jgi:hypothetical protein
MCVCVYCLSLLQEKRREGTDCSKGEAEGRSEGGEWLYRCRSELSALGMKRRRRVVCVCVYVWRVILFEQLCARGLLVASVFFLRLVLSALDVCVCVCVSWHCWLPLHSSESWGSVGVLLLPPPAPPSSLFPWRGRRLALGLACKDYIVKTCLCVCVCVCVYEPLSVDIKDVFLCGHPSNKNTDGGTFRGERQDLRK